MRDARADALFDSGSRILRRPCRCIARRGGRLRGRKGLRGSATSHAPPYRLTLPRQRLFRASTAGTRATWSARVRRSRASRFDASMPPNWPRLDCTVLRHRGARSRLRSTQAGIHAQAAPEKRSCPDTRTSACTEGAGSSRGRHPEGSALACGW